MAGSVAAYAHGVPAGLQHDADLLEADGIEVRIAPEDWLIKARSHGDRRPICGGRIGEAVWMGRPSAVREGHTRSDTPL